MNWAKITLINLRLSMDQIEPRNERDYQQCASKTYNSTTSKLQTIDDVDGRQDTVSSSLRLLRCSSIEQNEARAQELLRNRYTIHMYFVRFAFRIFEYETKLLFLQQFPLLFDRSKIGGHSQRDVLFTIHESRQHIFAGPSAHNIHITYIYVQYI